jgi:type I restriction enzyme S subunit
MPGADTEGGIPVVKVRDYDHNGIDVEQLLRAAPDIEAPYRRSRLEPGDILMSIRGTTGVIAVVPAELLGANITQDTARIRVDVANRDYLYQALHAPNVRRQIRLHTMGQAVKGINIGAVRQLQIPWPPEPTRILIARVLHDCDLQIRSVGRLIDAKRTNKRGLMQTLLTGQKRFPKLKDRPWEEVHLGELFDERNEINRPDLPLLSVTNDRGVIPRNELDKRDTSNPDKSKYKRVAIGDIAYNTMRMWQGVSALSPVEGIVSPAYTVAIPTGRIHGSFAKHLFKFPSVVNLFHRHSQGLVDDTLNLKFDRFAKIKLTIPSDPAEQARIASVLDTCDTEIELLWKLRRQFEDRKRALLSRLLSTELTFSSPP